MTDAADSRNISWPSWSPRVYQTLENLDVDYLFPIYKINEESDREDFGQYAVFMTNAGISSAIVEYGDRPSSPR